MTYMRFTAEMPNGDVHRGLRRLVVGHGIDAKMSAGTLELTGVAMPTPEVNASFSYRLAFTAADLTDNTLMIEHGLDEDSPMVQVWNNLGEVVQPDRIRRIGSNSTYIDLSSFGNIEGNWEVILIK